MITVHLCSSAAEEPFPQFQDDTTRCVCVPKDADCQLYVQIDGRGEVKIEADGEEIYANDIDADNRVVPLNDILNLNPPPRPIADTLFQSLRNRLTSPPPSITTFTVTVTQEEPTRQLATVHFRIYDPVEFEAAFNGHLRKVRVEPPRQPAVNSAAPLVQLLCWNCDSALTNSPRCPSCGADQDEEVTAQ